MCVVCDVVCVCVCTCVCGVVCVCVFVCTRKTGVTYCCFMSGAKRSNGEAPSAHSSCFFPSGLMVSAGGIRGGDVALEVLGGPGDAGSASTALNVTANTEPMGDTTIDAIANNDDPETGILVDSTFVCLSLSPPLLSLSSSVDETESNLPFPIITLSVPVREADPTPLATVEEVDVAYTGDDFVDPHAGVVIDPEALTDPLDAGSPPPFPHFFLPVRRRGCRRLCCCGPRRCGCTFERLPTSIFLFVVSSSLFQARSDRRALPAPAPWWTHPRSAW